MNMTVDPKIAARVVLDGERYRRLALEILGSETAVDNWIMFGVFYGYPDCCIRDFMGRSGGELSHEQNVVHGCRGFIPCHECAVEVASGRKDISELITERVYHRPYPIDQMDPM